MAEPKDFYDVQKMLQEEAKKLVTDTKNVATKWENDEQTNARVSAEINKQLEDTEDWLSSLGIDVDEIKKKADVIGTSEAQKNIMHNEEVVKTAFPEVIGGPLSYEELVSKAHDLGFNNTSIQDLLTEDEINIADARLESIESEFQKKTKLNKTDSVFLAIAVALQVLRQYVLDPYIKKQRQDAGSHDEKAHGKKEPGWYRVEKDRILVNTVPFDAGIYGQYDTVKDFLKGHKNHRESTLGHDPVLGWVFGTMNIMTGTITNYHLQTAHVKYIAGKGNVIYAMASTTTMSDVVKDRVLTEGYDGKLSLGCALLREAIHLKSDVTTTHGIPLPLVNSVTPEFGELLSKYGIDVAGVGTEASLSMLINAIIAMVHRLFKKEEEDENIYQVRTRKILLYSNSIATASNLIAVGIGTAVGVVGENPDLVEKSIDKLDIGGLLVTISRLFSDIRFIAKVKEEFIRKRLDEPIIKEIEYLDSLLAECKK